MEELLTLKPDHLKTHPRNMRRFYPDAQVREMADSIKASNGVVQPMIVTNNGAAGYYYVIDGNLRLAAARSLGQDCPDLVCRLTHGSDAEQMLMMVATTVRFDVDPISEALHYRALLREKYDIEQIAEATGKSVVTISNRLRLLELDDDIQQLVAAGKLPRDPHVVSALNSVKDRDIRIKLARKFAEDGASYRAINSVCQKMVERLGAAETRRQRTGRPAAGHNAPGVPMQSHAEGRAHLHVPGSNVVAEWGVIRTAARAMCDACSAKETELHDLVEEPAWVLITHSAAETCQACNVRDAAGVCNQCPGVDLLQRLIRASVGKGVAGGH